MGGERDPVSCPLYSTRSIHMIRPMDHMTAKDSLPGRASRAVGRIRVASAAEALADALRAAILDGEIKPGSMLPNERDLAEESGLGRGSVREALKILAGEGLVASRVGRNGGCQVQQPPPEAVVRYLDVFIRARRIHPDSLLEVREVIEPSCAFFAAHRRSAAHLARLEELTREMAQKTDDVPQFLELNISWHVLIAEASANEILASVMTAISTNIRSAIGVDAYESPEMMQAAQHLHERVLIAIADRDADAAYRRMCRHLRATSDIVRPSLPPGPGDLNHRPPLGIHLPSWPGE